MIGLAYFLIIWLGVGLLTGIKFIFVDQVYDEEFKELMDKETAMGEENCYKPRSILWKDGDRQYHDC